MTAPILPRAVLFDLLTALIDSWTAWNAAAGSEAQGRAWRAAYLRMTYGCGAYQPACAPTGTTVSGSRDPTGYRRRRSSGRRSTG